MIHYLDPSVWIKLFLVHEAGSDAVADLWDSGDPMATGEIAHVEMRATFARKEHHGALGPMDAINVGLNFSAAWESVHVVKTTSHVLSYAATVASTYAPLRGYDAVHLASALMLDPNVVMVTADDELLHAARAAELPATDLGILGLRGDDAPDG